MFMASEALLYFHMILCNIALEVVISPVAYFSLSVYIGQW